MSYDIFLAHAGADATVAEQLYDLLVPPHAVFLDTRSLRPGDVWDDVIPRAQRAARMTVVLISPHVEAAWYAREEIVAAIDLARHEGGRVVPVYLDGATPDVPYGLRRVHGLCVARAGGLAGIAERLSSLLAALPIR